jgi:hypothetical protein
MSATKAMDEAKIAPSPSRTSPAPSTSIPTAISAATQEVLNLSFPRCSCCKTGWYDALGDDDDGANSRNLAVAAEKRKRNRDRPSHHNLLPMPKCECTTRLALPPLPSAIYSTNACDPTDVLKQIKTFSFQNLAICKACLKHRIAASKEVTVHDYHQGHIPNGQRDVRFTVELCCVQCKRKFSGRFLEKLLESEGASRSTNIAGSNIKKSEKLGANWQDAVDSTIKLVGWAKRDRRKEWRRIRQRRKNEKLNHSGLVNRNEQILSRWGNLYGFTGGDGNCSSDECYSFSSDSSDDCDELLRPAMGPHRLELKPGELMAELLQKDPKFRQEKEDEQYVKTILEEQESNTAKVAALDAQAIEDERYVMKLIEEENEAKRKEAERRLREDHEIAMKIEKEFNKQNISSEPVKTRSKSPIFDAWKKASTSSDVSGKKFPRTPVSVDNIPRKIRAYQELDDEVSVISTTPGEAALEAASRTFIKSHHLPNNNNRKRARGKLSDERATSQLSDKIVDEIVAMGFSEASAQRSLMQADGNVQRAMELLLSESSDPP